MQSASRTLVGNVALPSLSRMKMAPSVFHNPAHKELWTTPVKFENRIPFRGGASLAANQEIMRLREVKSNVPTHDNTVTHSLRDHVDRVSERGCGFSNYGSKLLHHRFFFFFFDDPAQDAPDTNSRGHHRMDPASFCLHDVFWDFRSINPVRKRVR